jgi:hypothetical protein
MAFDTYVGGGQSSMRSLVAQLYRRYGTEISAACYRAAPRDRPTNGYDLYPSWLTAFGTLKMSV